jgi:hypothetical protein
MQASGRDAAGELVDDLLPRQGALKEFSGRNQVPKGRVHTRTGPLVRITFRTVDLTFRRLIPSLVDLRATSGRPSSRPSAVPGARLAAPSSDEWSRL